MELHKNISSVGILVCLLVFVTIVYYPALDSRFLMDDIYNLAGLADIETKGINYYIFGGFAGPSGRPLSLLSFALQYQHWPNNPAVFKAVNLIIHLFNGVLIWFISRRLIRFVEPDKHYQLLFAILVTTMWLIHPMQMSTVLYVIQRMTQLSTLFTLMGILGYLYVRDPASDLSQPSRERLVPMSLYVGGCTFLAILCKENGILLPLFILIIEATLLIQLQRTVYWTRWAWIFLVLPLLILVIYLVSNFTDVVRSYEFRTFTLEQRLLTQPGVLLSYLKDILFPSYGAFTIYHDDYLLSSGLTEPPYTLFAIIVLGFLLLTAILFRRDLPVLSFAILWFLAGHLLESTYLNLELYFEHRNYLPIFGICFGISWLSICVLKRTRLKAVIIPSVFAYYALVVTVSTIEAKTWSKPALQAVEWARLHPQSIRALDDLAALYLSKQDYKHALAVFDRIDSLQINDIYTPIQKIKIAHCSQGVALSEQEWQVNIDKAGVAAANGLKVIAILDSLIGEIVADRCQAIDHKKLLELLSALTDNPEFGLHRGFLFEYIATLNVYSKDYNEALISIRKALRFSPKPSIYINEIHILKLLGREDEMRQKISRFKEMINKDPRDYLAYNKVVTSLERY